MRTRVLVLSTAAVVGAASVMAYRAFRHEYQYFQRIQLGDQLLAEGLPFQAARAYGSAIGLDPAEPAAYLKRAEAEHRQGNLAPALEDLERALERTPDAPQVWHRLADVQAELGRFDDAAAGYERVLARDPDDVTVMYRLGLARFRGGRETEAIDALGRAVAAEPEFWEAFYLRGAVYRALGAVEEAASDYGRALTLRPENAAVRQALFELHLEHGRTDVARELVDWEIEHDPGAAAPYLRLAAVHRVAGSYASAIEAVGMALEQDPDSPAAYVELGELWLDEAARSGDPVALDKAVSALETAARMDPESGAACLALGRAYLSAGDEERGFELLARASAATPSPAEAHRLLGDLYRARRNREEAVTAYHVALRLEGDSPAVLQRLADTYGELEQHAVAAETYLRLAELDPTVAGPLVQAARAWLAAGEPEHAAAVCRRGLSVNPENPSLKSLLARAQARAPRQARIRGSEP